MNARRVLVAIALASIHVRVEGQQPSEPAQELVVRVLDVGQGDATYIQNGSSKVIIDGGPAPAAFGRYLDSLDLDNSTIDIVILSHQHLDHYSGLRELFKTSRHIRIRYFFENKDPSAAVTLAKLRDSILSRMDRDSLIYRDTDDPCSDGRPICSFGHGPPPRARAALTAGHRSQGAAE